MKCLKGFLCELYNLSYESANSKYEEFFFCWGKKKNKKQKQVFKSYDKERDFLV